jgi:hypothetical protein
MPPPTGLWIFWARFYKYGTPTELELLFVGNFKDAAPMALSSLLVFHGRSSSIDAA